MLNTSLDKCRCRSIPCRETSFEIAEAISLIVHGCGMSGGHYLWIILLKYVRGGRTVLSINFQVSHKFGSDSLYAIRMNSVLHTLELILTEIICSSHRTVPTLEVDSNPHSRHPACRRGNDKCPPSGKIPDARRPDARRSSNFVIVDSYNQGPPDQSIRQECMRSG